MPVVRVHQINRPPLHLTQLLHQRENPTRKQNKATVVIGLAVNHLALKGGRDIQQVHRRRLIGQLPDAQLFVPFANRQKAGANRADHGEPLFAELPEVRHHHAHVMPGRTQRGRQGPRHIG